MNLFFCAKVTVNNKIQFVTQISKEKIQTNINNEPFTVSIADCHWFAKRYPKFTELPGGTKTVDNEIQDDLFFKSLSTKMTIFGSSSIPSNLVLEAILRLITFIKHFDLGPKE